MKRIKQHLSKFRRTKQPAEDKLDSRITNETVAEHREQIIAGGRKFKYPVQYSRHRLVVNSLLIVIGSVIVMTALLLWLLYVVQDTSKLLYRVTQFVPVPVASVDDESVRYSDYLRRLRSSLHFLESQQDLSPKTEDGQRQINYRKRVELDNSIYDTYVTKLARQHSLSVSNREIDLAIEIEIQQKHISKAVLQRTLSNYYDWSLEDYRSSMRMDLLKRKVSFTIDQPARQKAERIISSLRSGSDFGELARVESDDQITKANGGDSGIQSIESADSNGVVAAVRKHNPGELTGLISGTDGYYIAKLVAKSDTSTQYQVIKIGFTELQRRFDEVKRAGRVKEYIKIGT
ncbi:MAG: peptidylprolyl isomerase [Candidatus Saccharimonadales bacterium]